MDFLRIKLFPANLVEAIGSTLIHSLWQGVILSIITGFIIMTTRKSSPATRYNLLISALVLFMSGVAVTLAMELNSHRAQGASLNPQPAVISQPFKVNEQLQLIQVIRHEPTLKEVTINLINKNANSIVLIWFVIVFARSLQLASGLNGLYYLRRNSRYAINDQIKNRVKELASKLGVSQVVDIAQSGIAKVPMVIGHFKPLILIPIGLITMLTAEEVEAILLHELAHVRRRDYLVNMLQSFMEIIFFFNPAVLWTSALIKTERENCCDDIVLAQSSSKADYIKALVSCQEYHMSTRIYAVALTGNKNHLLTRVKRMLSNNNQSLNVMEKSLLAVCLFSAGLLTVAFTNAEKINILVANTAKAIEHVAVNINKNEPGLRKPLVKPNVPGNILSSKIDTPKIDKFKIYHPRDVRERTSVSVQNNLFTTYLYKQDGILYQLNYKDKALKSMQINGKSVADYDVASYQSIINKILAKNNAQYAGLTEMPEKTPLTNGASENTATPEQIQKMLTDIVKEKAAENTPSTTGSTENTATPEQIQKLLADIVKEKADAENNKKANFDQFVAYGDDYRKHGQYQDAIDFYRKAETINPVNPEVEKKITDTRRILDATPEEKRKKLYENAEADAIAKNQEQVNSLIEQGDYYRSKHQYQAALDVYKKAETISPSYLHVERIIAYTQEQLNQYVRDSVKGNYSNSYNNTPPTQPKPTKTYVKVATPPYTTNHAYTAEGRSEQARRDSTNQANIIADMVKDGLINSPNPDKLSFKISTEEFIVNGEKQPDNIYQKYRAKYVKVVGDGQWSWYHNYDSSQKRTVNSITNEPEK